MLAVDTDENLSWTRCSATSAVVDIKNDNMFRFVSKNVLEVVRSGYYYIYLQLAATKSVFTCSDLLAVLYFTNKQHFRSVV